MVRICIQLMPPGGLPGGSARGVVPTAPQRRGRAARRVRSPRLSVAAATVPAMAKSATAAIYECSECGWRTTKWVGPLRRVPGLGQRGRGGAARRRPGRAWPRAARAAPGRDAAAPPRCRSAQVDAAAARARPTGMAELDRVLGGGLVPGAVVLLAGEPGVGKSTLLLEAGALAAAAGRVLYVTGEESAAQVRQRADRIGALSDTLLPGRRDRLRRRCSRTSRRSTRRCSSWTRCRPSARPASTACPAA